jgi:hypothetical protein
MKTLRTRLGVIQNISLVDRMMRAAATALLLAVPAIYIVNYDGAYQWWHGVMWLLSIYFGLTALCGCDPFYRAADYKTCDGSGKNQCGTLPYQVDAALGNKPVPEKDFDHSLSGSRHPGQPAGN